MSDTQIWHNPRCSKSRQTLELLIEHNINPEIVLYKDTAPSEADIRAVLLALEMAPLDLIRKNDAAFKSLNLGPETSEAQMITAMANHPEIIERPVVRHNGKAAIGRPAQDVLKLFK